LFAAYEQLKFSSNPSYKPPIYNLTPHPILSLLQRKTFLLVILLSSVGTMREWAVSDNSEEHSAFTIRAKVGNVQPTN
jgi:hypothetical protein